MQSRVVRQKYSGDHQKQESQISEKQQGPLNFDESLILNHQNIHQIYQDDSFNSIVKNPTQGSIDSVDQCLQYPQIYQKHPQCYIQSQKKYEPKCGHRKHRKSMKKTKNANGQSFREIKKWHRFKPYIDIINNFQQMKKRQGSSINLQSIKTIYSHPDKTKSFKYFIHRWYNIIYQGYGDQWFVYLNNYSLPYLIGEIDDLYSDKSQYFCKQLKNQIDRVFCCLEKFRVFPNLKEMIYQLYEVNPRGLKNHRTKEKSAKQCYDQLERIFPDVEQL